MSVQFRRVRIAGFKSFAEPVSVEIHRGSDRHRRPERLRQVQCRRGAALGDGGAEHPLAARRRDGRCDLRRHRGPAVAQSGRGDADAGRHGRRRAAAVPRTGGAGDRPPHRARLRQRIPGERQGGARARRADAVRRPGDRRARLRHGEPGTGRRAGHRQAGGSPRGAGGSGRHHRAARAPARGGAEAARRRDQSGAGGRPARAARGRSLAR